MAEAKASGMKPSGIADSSIGTDGIDAKRKRNGVAERKRHRAERRAPDDPSQLALHGDRARALQRAQENRERRREESGEIQELEPIEQRDQTDEIVGIDARSQQRQRARRTENRRGQIDRRQPARQQRRVARHVRPLRKHQREVQEERRQHQQRDDVAPVEDPVDAIQPAAEREGEQAEERHRQPEEVQRRLIVRTSRANRRADQQREDADAGEQVIEEAGAVRDRLERDLRDFAIAEAKQRVGVARAGFGAMLKREHVGAALDRLAVDRQQHVAWLDARAIGRRRTSRPPRQRLRRRARPTARRPRPRPRSRERRRWRGQGRAGRASRPPAVRYAATPPTTIPR